MTSPTAPQSFSFPMNPFPAYHEHRRDFMLRDDGKHHRRTQHGHPANRILKSTLNRLLACGVLTPENLHDVRKARDWFSEVANIRLTEGSFHRIQLHSNNRHYRLLMHVL